MASNSMSKEEFDTLRKQKEKKPSKYRNKKTVVDGISFDSKKEAARYCELKLLEKAGKISCLKLQPEFVLQEKFRYAGHMFRAIGFRGDFQYRETGNWFKVVEDVKGWDIKTEKFRLTEVYKIKRKMFIKKFGGRYELREV